MKSVLVIGLGRFGTRAARKFEELGQDVMAVDSREERVNDILPFVTDAMIGDATRESFLSSIGVGNFDLVLVAIGDDFQSSLETTSLLKELGAKYVVSRAKSDVHEKFLLNNGADEVVYPERQLADQAAIRYSSDHIFDYVELGKAWEIYEVDIPKEWQGKTIAQLDVRRKYGINIIGIREQGQDMASVGPDTVLSSSQRMMVTGDKKTIYKIFMRE